RNVYVARYSGPALPVPPVQVFTLAFFFRQFWAFVISSWFVYVTWSPLTVHSCPLLVLRSNITETLVNCSARVGHEETAAGVSHTIEPSGDAPAPIVPVVPSTVIVIVCPSCGFVFETSIAAEVPSPVSCTLFAAALIVCFTEENV